LLNSNRGTNHRSALPLARAAAIVGLLGISCSSASGAGRVAATPSLDRDIARRWYLAPSEKTHLRGRYVSRVIDGDTIAVRVAGETREVGLIGINAPETAGDKECYGREAATHTSLKLEGGRVRLELDVDKESADGSLLAYVWHRGTLFNRALVSGGYARVATVRPNTRYSDLLVQAQKSAKGKRRGMWDACYAPPRKPEPKAKSKRKSGKR
jgi:micrococcal nuclease